MEDTHYSKIWMNIIQENEQYAIRLDKGQFNAPYEIHFHHNSVIDNNLAGTSQAFSLYATNYFYDLNLLEGNFWSDWISGSYTIDCINALYDLYPLSESPHGIEV